METSKKPLYQQLASLVQAIENCRQSGNAEWLTRHTERVEKLVREWMPSGSGFDAGTKLDMERSTSEKLVFYTSFHHMDEHGGYDGWSEHTVFVSPSLAYGFTLRIVGRNRNEIRECIAEMFHLALHTPITEKDFA